MDKTPDDLPDLTVEQAQAEILSHLELFLQQAKIPGEIIVLSDEKSVNKEPVFGIMLKIPVTEILWDELNRSGYILPLNIKEIQFITLKPEEHIKTADRLSQRSGPYDSSLASVAKGSTIITPEGALRMQLLGVFGNSREAKQAFCSSLPTDPTKTILKIYKGHGGGIPFTIGEHSMSDGALIWNGKLCSLRELEQLLMTTDVSAIKNQGAIRVQAPGNHIRAQALLDIDDTVRSPVAGVVLLSCNPKQDTFATKSLSVATVNGVSRGVGGLSDDLPRIPVVFDPAKKELLTFTDERADVKN